MKLDKVTITGADESINPQQLKDISKEYPFVEWGILYSKKHNNKGAPRYPQQKWINNLHKINKESMCLSLHLCGSIVRDLATHAKWKISPLTKLTGFNRVQLNFSNKRLDFHEDFIDVLPYRKRFIFQMNGINDNIIYKALYLGRDVVPLFDNSCGTGILPSEWPKPIAGIHNGYAGGLGPKNLKKQLDKIANVVKRGRIWIDMETNVRSNNGQQFDLNKVTKCLDIAEKYMSK